MTAPALPFSDIVRVNQIGAGLRRTLEPDPQACRRIARDLDLQALDDFVVDLTLAPVMVGWRLAGRVTARAVQTCGLTLEPLPIQVDRAFSLDLIEAPDSVEPGEIEVSLDDESPDWIEDGRIDLGQYAVEQLALSLDPFPRKPGAEFVQPEEPGERSPFDVLRQLRPEPPEDQG